jgi:7-carboxy-7-deazaguanine synthase
VKNPQPPEKRVHDTCIDVHSIFYTIQGEGPFTGTPAVFIRLAGCNIQCEFCDTDYTVGRSLRSINSIILEVNAVLQQNPIGLVVITGGEPFRQDIAPLINALMRQRFYVQIETNGTLPPPQVLFNTNPQSRAGPYIVVSPKGSKVHYDTMHAACAYKYVMAHTEVDLEDGLPTKVLGHPCATRVARPPRSIPIYLQPADHQNGYQNSLNLKACIRSCMTYGYLLQLQVHKLIGME